MYDRRAGGAEGSLACPFLALAGDRDARADVADRRHRCYAEPEPAPRAIAHQENYCLTTGFVGCPTFADWVRREGARVVGSGAAPRAPEAWREPISPPDEPRRTPPEPGADPVLRGAAFEAPVEAPGARAADGVVAPGLWEDERSWAAPPPWLRGDDADERPSERSGGGAADASVGPGDGELGSSRRGPRPSQPAEPDWGQAALRGQPIEPVVDESAESRPTSTRRPFDERWDDVAEGSVVAASAGAAEASLGAVRSEPPAELPAFLASRRPPDARGEIARPGSHARSASDALASYQGAGDRSAAVEHRAPVGSGAGRPSVDYRPDGTPRPGRVPERFGTSGAASRPAARELPGPVGADVSESRGDRGIPPWENGRRRDAYPDLRPRMTMPRLPRLWLGLVALFLAGIVLFLLPTVIPSIFTGGPAATKTPAATVGPSVSIAPTPPPAPTAQVYTVAEGDTLSGIAAKFRLTVNQLVKANPQIKDPNKLAIGDQLTIPARAASAGESAGASGAP